MKYIFYILINPHNKFEFNSILFDFFSILSTIHIYIPFSFIHSFSFKFKQTYFDE